MPPDKIPHPAVSKVVIAETEEGEIAGFLMAQMALHMEPLFIKRKFRHAVRFPKLVSKLEEAIGHDKFFCFTESPVVEKMLAFMKFVKLPWTIWKRK